MLPPLLERLLRSLSPAGLILGALFFAISLTPSLVPRPFVLQGLLSGVALAAGYGIAMLGRGIWHYLELPVARGHSYRALKLVLGLLCLGVAVAFLLQASTWQNTLRGLMQMPPVESSRPLSVGLIAIGIFALLLALARLFGFFARRVSAWLNRLVPRRISTAAGLLVAFLLFWSLVDGVLTRVVMHAFDTSFSQLDALIEDDVPPPTDPLFTGSAESLINWKDLGRQGRRFVGGTPDSEGLARFSDHPVRRPLRVYAGLNSAETIDERVELAFDELLRAGGFERKVLVIITPTGTGWVDAGAVTSVEYLHRGDVASVAVQYSYLPSWLSLLAQPDYGADTARALFQRVYGYWQTLPADQRPHLYLQGLSLGALNSQRSADAWDIVGDPLQGALWSGPPFRSANWRWITAHRNAGSPAWLPRFRDGSLVRFTNQDGDLADFAAPWGPLRIVYLQYASDPITFFDPLAFLREPEWLSGPRGPDVSPDLRWFPVVTMLQLAVDIVADEYAPVGYGHSYAIEHYIDAWLAVSAPEGWTGEEVRRLKAAIGDLNHAPH